MTLPQPIPFFSAAAIFAAGNDTPREFLERCLSHVEEFEPAVGAFVCHAIAAARAAADRSAARWRDDGTVSYWASPKDCRACPLKPRCTKGERGRTRVRACIERNGSLCAFGPGAAQSRNGIRPSEAKFELPTTAAARDHRRLGRVHACRHCPKPKEAGPVYRRSAANTGRLPIVNT